MRLTSLIPVLLAGCLLSPRPAAQTPKAPLVIEHVTVVDVHTGQLLADHSLVVSGPRIARLGPSSSIAIPTGSRVVNGRKKFVIPGLWDMHVHIFNNASDPGTHEANWYFPLFIANGVTGVRDMWTDLDDTRLVREWNRQLAAGRLVGPRITPTGPLLDGVRPVWPNAVSITDAARARAVVDSLVRGGVETLKIYDGLSPEVYDAVVAEAKRLGVPFVGHVPLQLLGAEVSDAGQRTIEHLQINEDCSTGGVEALGRRRTGQPVEAGGRKLILDTHSDSLCVALFRKLVRNATWQVPVLVGRRQGLLRGDTAFINPWHRDTSLRYVRAAEAAQWEARSVDARRRATAESVDLGRREFQNLLHITGSMFRAGVPILAGTDIGNPYRVAGFSLHEELALLVKAGVTPLGALQAATLNPATFLNAADSLGSVTAGRLADLVVLDADPLTDITNTRKIHAVVLNGRYMNRASLDALLLQGRAAASRPPPTARRFQR
jgi:imidazolonepropionase-like amidohydrolase